MPTQVLSSGVSRVGDHRVLIYKFQSLLTEILFKNDPPKSCSSNPMAAPLVFFLCQTRVLWGFGTRAVNLSREEIGDYAIKIKIF